MKPWTALLCAACALCLLAGCEEDEPLASDQPAQNNSNNADNSADNSDNNADNNGNNADNNGNSADNNGNNNGNNADNSDNNADNSDNNADNSGNNNANNSGNNNANNDEPDADVEPDAEPDDAQGDAEPDADEEPDAQEPDVPDEPALEDPPQAPGPWRGAVIEATVTREDRQIPVVAHLPLNFGGAAPLVVFTPGFQLDSYRYEPLCEHLASHGFVVVRADPPDPLFGVSHAQMADDISEVIDWATDPAGDLADLVDPERVGVMGHSLGGKVSAMVASRDERVGALLGIDPVNAGSPLTGFTQDLPDILPEWLQDLTTPMGFMGETVNAVGIGPACAPADGNFTQFYAAGAASDWRAAWDFIGADHIDFVDDRDGCPFTVCGLCPDGPADDATIPPKVHTLAAAFFRLHLAGDLEVEPWLDGDQLPDAITVTRPD